MVNSGDQAYRSRMYGTLRMKFSGLTAIFGSEYICLAGLIVETVLLLQAVPR